MLARFLLPIAIGVGLSNVASAQTYSLTDLGTGVANSINDAGQVVGSLRGTATIWNGTKPIALSTLPGGIGSVAQGINNAGEVVGTTYTATNSIATVWKGTTPTALSTLPGGTGSVGWGINNAGRIVGYSHGANQSQSTAVFWNGITPTTLDSPAGSTYSQALGINQLGQVASYNTGIADYFTTLWNLGRPTVLNTLPGGIGSQAYSINDTGTAAGVTLAAGGSYVIATIWNGTKPIALSTLPGKATGYAYSISNKGQVVGFSASPPSNVDEHATLWENGTILDLNQLLDASGNGWTLQVAYGINNVGQIVGAGINPQGQSDAFLLTPSPSLQVSPSTNIIASGSHWEGFRPASFHYQLTSTTGSVNL
jgi:probable HAF family extracellular repeat protein